MKGAKEKLLERFNQTEGQGGNLVKRNMSEFNGLSQRATKPIKLI